MTDDTHSGSHLHRRILHGKRPVKHSLGLAVDSPLYDASGGSTLDSCVSTLAQVRELQRRTTTTRETMEQYPSYRRLSYHAMPLPVRLSVQMPILARIRRTRVQAADRFIRIATHRMVDQMP